MSSWTCRMLAQFSSRWVVVECRREWVEISFLSMSIRRRRVRKRSLMETPFDVVDLLDTPETHKHPRFRTADSRPKVEQKERLGYLADGHHLSLSNLPRTTISRRSKSLSQTFNLAVPPRKGGTPTKTMKVKASSPV